MKPCDDATYARIAARTPAYPGELIVVLTTHIACRVGCTARTPLQRNIMLVDSLDEAVAAGFRPCKRCRPDRFGPMPDDVAFAALVREFAALAAEPEVARAGVSAIARRLHVSDRQLRRVVRAAFDCTPSEYLRTQRREVA